MGKINLKVLEKLNSINRNEMENAFNVIYQEYAYLVYYISLKMVRESEIAEEIMNETFYRFFVNKNQIQSSKNIKYYLISICKNLSYDYLNHQKKMYELNDDSSLQISVQTKDHFSDYIHQFKDFLNEEEIDILVLHFLYGYTFKEIAQERKVTTNKISSKYHRIIQKVRKHYKGDI